MLLGYLKKKIRYIGNSGNAQGAAGQKPAETQGEWVAESLEENLSSLKNILSNSTDIKIHKFCFGPNRCFSGALVFIDGLVDNRTLTQAILWPLMSWQPEGSRSSAGRQLLETIGEDVLCAGEVGIQLSLQGLVSGCLMGDTAVLVEGCAAGLVVNTKGWEKRSVTEPQSETVVRGPREGFTENLRTNTALIRRKIQNGKLRVEMMKVGRKTHTNVCLLYLDGVADPKVVEEVKYRIGRIQTDAILESGYIEEFIEDAPYSPFSTIWYTEKPDVAAGCMLEGRVAIVVDGTPFVLTVPMLFIECFQTAEDYYNRPLYASLMRMLRYLAFLIAVYAPAVYIALTAFHQELIPTRLLLTIANAREETPFPGFVEALIMLLAFEILREAGIRLPRPVGQAISIVGALIMGDAAVSAGLVGAPVVITIAITAVAGFLIPNQNDSISILRVVMMALAWFAGWYGISMGTMAVLFHLGSLSSFGVPYFDGFSRGSYMEDTFVRMPIWSMIRRPKGIARGDVVRQGPYFPSLRPFESRDRNDEGTEKATEEEKGHE